MPSSSERTATLGKAGRQARSQWYQARLDESLRIVLLKAFLVELGLRLRNSKESEEAQQAAKELGWLTEDGKWKALTWNPTAGALEEVARGRTWTTDAIIAETVELRKLMNAETIYRFQSIKGLATDSMGATGTGDKCQRIRTPRLGNCTVMGRLLGFTHPRLSLTAGAGRSFATGPLTTLVSPSTQFPATVQPGPLVLPTTSQLSDWRAVDEPRGISQVLQCFLWTMHTDHRRRSHAAGLIKHLWHRICHDPSRALPLRGDLFWMPLVALQTGSIHGLLHAVLRA